MDTLWSLSKIVLGTSQMIGGVVTATGHGLIGTFCNQHHCLPAAIKYGTEQFEKGAKKIEDGFNEIF